MESKKESFKNRRQKALRPVAVKLEQIQDKKSSLSRRRMMAIVAIPLALLILGGVYLVFAQDKTRILRDAMQQSRQAVQSKVTDFGTHYKKANDKKRVEMLASLRFAALECGHGWLYPPLNSLVKQCNDRNQAIKQANDNSETLLAALRYDQSVRTIIETASAAADPWDKRQAAWETATKQLQAIGPPSQIRTPHESLMKQSQELAKAWKTLRTADAAKNIDAFKAAKKELASRYEALRKVSELYQTVYDELQEKMLKSYRELKS